MAKRIGSNLLGTNFTRDGNNKRTSIGRGKVKKSSMNKSAKRTLKNIVDKDKEEKMGPLVIWFLILSLGVLGAALYSIKNT